MTTSNTVVFRDFPIRHIEQARELVADVYRKLARGAARAGQAAPATPELVVLEQRKIAQCTMCGDRGAECEIGDACPTCDVGTVWGRVVADVEFRAERPHLDGWELLAVIEPMTGGNMLRTVPGAEIAEGELNAYRTGDQSHCDHCATRRQRSETFVVRGTAGAKLVGRNCLADFLGGKSVADILARLALVRQIEQLGEEGEGGGWSREQPMLVADFLAWTSAAVRLDGFLSRTAARERSESSTADCITFLLGAPPMHPASLADWRENRKRLAPTDADKATAAAVIAWAAVNDDPSDYMHNVRLACAQPAILGKHAGVLASAVSAWERATGARVRAEREARGTAPSAHVGEVKAKITATVTVERVADVETQYGIQHFHALRDERGNALLWKTGSRRLPVGWTGEITATVKKHTEFRGEAQTEVVRPKGNFPAEGQQNDAVNAAIGARLGY